MTPVGDADATIGAHRAATDRSADVSDPCLYARAGAPGEVLTVTADAITVACGVGALRLTELQRAGGKRLAAPQFLQGRPIAPGLVFEPVSRQ